MDAEIHFGEVEEAQPEVRLRPDENKHYCVVAFESPRQNDLPIYVDLDVMRDMEAHALSDTSVELGGVLLGGQYLDQQGRPFVLVSDSLRAHHFEATKGSFKFTHETWQRISRERDEFPDDLQMVGWYHTHPDWGVFLSGMDMFICDNFFNRALDLALVIDPCRGDRGMFQWVDDPRERIRRTGGFYLIASRFRRAEMQRFAAQMENGSPMTHDPHYNPVAGQVGPATAPVVNITDSRAGWHVPATMAMLLVQFILLVLIAWKMLTPPASTAGEEPKDKESTQQLAKLDDKVDKLLESKNAQLESDIQARVLQRVVAALGQGNDGIVQEVADLERQVRRAESESRGFQAMSRQWVAEQAQLQATVDSLQQQTAALKKSVESRDSRIAEYRKTLKSEQAKVANLEKQVALWKGDDKQANSDDDDSRAWSPLTIGISVAVLLLLVAAAVGALIVSRREAAALDEQRETETGNAEDEESC